MSKLLNICAGMPIVSPAIGATILNEGGTDKRLYVLIEGAVEILKGDIQVTVVSKPGAVFGEIAVLLDSPHSASVRVIEPSRLYEVEDGPALLASHPQLALSVARLEAARLQQVTSYLADIKRQFQDQGDHLSMVDEVLHCLLHDHPADAPESPGSDREYEPNQ